MIIGYSCLCLIELSIGESEKRIEKMHSTSYRIDCFAEGFRMLNILSTYFSDGIYKPLASIEVSRSQH